MCLNERCDIPPPPPRGDTVFVVVVFSKSNPFFFSLFFLVIYFLVANRRDLNTMKSTHSLSFTLMKPSITGCLIREETGVRGRGARRQREETPTRRSNAAAI